MDKFPIKVINTRNVVDIDEAIQLANHEISDSKAEIDELEFIMSRSYHALQMILLLLVNSFRTTVLKLW